MLFVRLPHDVIDEKWPSLSLPAKALYPVLARHANFQTGQCRPSVDHLARAAGISARSVNKSLLELADAGLIRVHRSPKPGVRNRYTVPDVVRPPAGDGAALSARGAPIPKREGTGRQQTPKAATRPKTATRERAVLRERRDLDQGPGPATAAERQAVEALTSQGVSRRAAVEAWRRLGRDEVMRRADVVAWRSARGMVRDTGAYLAWAMRAPTLPDPPGMSRERDLRRQKQAREQREAERRHREQADRERVQADRDQAEAILADLDIAELRRLAEAVLADLDPPTRRLLQRSGRPVWLHPAVRWGVADRLGRERQQATTDDQGPGRHADECRADPTPEGAHVADSHKPSVHLRNAASIRQAAMCNE